MYKWSFLLYKVIRREHYIEVKTMQQPAGTIKDMASEANYEVFVDFGPDTEIDQIYVVRGRTQVSDFPFGKVNKNDKLSTLAQKLVTEQLDTIEFSSAAETVADEDTVVIDMEDIF